MFMILELMVVALVACDPALTALFTPRHPQTGPLRGLHDRGADREGRAGSPIEATEPLDAFGKRRSYDRSKLARLYGGKRARVAHRWKQEGDAFET